MVGLEKTTSPGKVRYYSQKELRRDVGVPGNSIVKNLPASEEDAVNAVSIPGLGMSPWRRKWQPTPPQSMGTQRVRYDRVTEHAYKHNRSA